jgi:hypothetical protein
VVGWPVIVIKYGARQFKVAALSGSFKLRHEDPFGILSALYLIGLACVSLLVISVAKFRAVIRIQQKGKINSKARGGCVGCGGCHSPADSDADATAAGAA